MLILASASTARRVILDQLGIRFDVQPADIDESAFIDGTPYDLAEKIARAKALAVAQRVPQATVVAGDSLLAVDGDIFGKPKDRADASRMLRTFSGRAVDGVTALAIAKDGGKVMHSGYAAAQIIFRTLTASDLERYLDQPAAWRDRAGGLTFEHPATIALLAATHGDPGAIWGLPVNLFYQLLEKVRSV